MVAFIEDEFLATLQAELQNKQNKNPVSHPVSS
jgi:hypothetical protein